jgi:hypothetical protein
MTICCDLVFCPQYWKNENPKMFDFNRYKHIV